MTSKQVFNLQKINFKRKQKAQKKRHESICVKVDEVYDTQIDPEFVYNKFIDLEGRSSRNNLRIYGVTEKNDETWQKCEEHIGQVFSEKISFKNFRVE